MEQALAYWKSILGSLVVIGGALWGGYAFASDQFDKAVSSRVMIHMAQLAKKDDIQGLLLRLDTVQGQAATATTDRLQTQLKLQALQNQNEEQSKSVQKQLDLIIKLIEQRQ